MSFKMMQALHMKVFPTMKGTYGLSWMGLKNDFYLALNLIEIKMIMNE